MDSSSVTTQFMSVSDQIRASLFDLWATVIGALPEIVSALIVFVIGLIVAPVLAGVVRHVLRLARVDALAEKAGITEMFRRMDMTFTFSGVVGELVRWFFIIAFLIAAVDILGWSEVTEFLRSILLYLPNVIVAVIIVAVGLIVGDFLERVVTKGFHGTGLPVSNPELLGMIARYATITFAVLTALFQLGVAEGIIQILVAGVVFALALAFGLGGKDKAREIIERLDQRT